MSSVWWAVVLLAGAVCAGIGLALGSTERRTAAAAVVLLCAVAVLTAGIFGVVL